MWIFVTILIFIYSASGDDELVNAEIISMNKSQSIGTNQIAVLFEIKEGWHIYWKNPGDSGLPTEFEWDLPDNVSISKPHFPAPKKIPFSDMANYGYENEVLIFFELVINDEYQLDSIKLKSKINWLVCKEKCLPGSSEEEKVFLIKSDSKKSDYADLFHNYEKYLPQKINLHDVAELRDNNIIVKINNFENVEDAEFFPYQSGIFSHGANQNFNNNEKGFSLNLKLDNFRIENPDSLYGVLKIIKDKQIEYYEINVSLNIKE